ncbi:MAG: enoyl-CoA hydratase/isomerase family protein [Deltaproteobacteria bacterium]|nr:enoyl-CoA hydratase/isomerase family protein [Deltaproteobacteria bacterium]
MKSISQATVMGAGVIDLKEIKRQKGTIKSGKDSSLLDLGDGVACLEFHSRNDVAGEDLAEMIRFSLAEVEKNWAGRVIGHQGRNFCVGADLKRFVSRIESQDWSGIENEVKDIQDAFLKLKYCTRPVVAAPHGLAYGGGAEILLSSPRIRAAAGLSMGLVEPRVGLVPAAGGVKELTLRSLENLPEAVNADPVPFLKKTHERLCLAAASRNAHEAGEMGYLRNTDGISMNRDGLLGEAKETVLHLSKLGYVPPVPKKIMVPGRNGCATLKMTTYFLRHGGFITDYSAFIGDKLAYIMTGGDLPGKSLVDEQYLLDLELEVFMELVKEPQTQDRIRYMLEKGKPLLN